MKIDCIVFRWYFIANDNNSQKILSNSSINCGINILSHNCYAVMTLYYCISDTTICVLMNVDVVVNHRDE